MAIVRGPLSSDGWTPVPNHWTRDGNLSWRAKGLLTYIAGHARGYELTVAQIIDDGSDGKDSVQVGLEELERAGYLTRTRTRTEDGRWGSYDYELTETPHQGGSNQGGKSRTGPDQGEYDVSAGHNQSGSTAPVNPPAKKTTSKKTRENHPPGDADKEEAPEGPNAGSIVADWIDYCGGRGIKLTKQAVGRYAKKIKELLGEGFEPRTIKHALSLQLNRGKAAFPGMLDAFMIEVQGGKPATNSRQAPAYKTAAEKGEDRRTEEAAVARIADELAAQYGTDPKDPVANLKISKQARQIHESRSTSCQPVGYSKPDQDVVDAEWTEHPTDTPREVTAE